MEMLYQAHMHYNTIYAAFFDSQMAAHWTLVFTARVKSKGMGTNVPVTLFGKEPTVVSIISPFVLISEKAYSCECILF